MMDEDGVSADRATFVTHVQNYWTAISLGDSKRANKQSALADAVVHRRQEFGKVVEFLLPLLKHESAAIQCAAATALLKYPPNEKAIQVLQRLQTASVGLVGSAAEVALISYLRSFK